MGNFFRNALKCHALSPRFFIIFWIHGLERRGTLSNLHDNEEDGQAAFVVDLDLASIVAGSRATRQLPDSIDINVERCSRYRVPPTINLSFLSSPSPSPLRNRSRLLLPLLLLIGAFDLLVYLFSCDVNVQLLHQHFGGRFQLFGFPFFAIFASRLSFVDLPCSSFESDPSMRSRISQMSWMSSLRIPSSRVLPE